MIEVIIKNLTDDAMTVLSISEVSSVQDLTARLHDIWQIPINDLYLWYDGEHRRSGMLHDHNIQDGSMVYVTRWQPHQHQSWYYIASRLPVARV
jgi:hypothetical protein